MMAAVPTPEVDRCHTDPMFDTYLSDLDAILEECFVDIDLMINSSKQARVQVPSRYSNVSTLIWNADFV